MKAIAYFCYYLQFIIGIGSIAVLIYFAPVILEVFRGNGNAAFGLALIGMYFIPIGIVDLILMSPVLVSCREKLGKYRHRILWLTPLLIMFLGVVLIALSFILL